MKPLSEAVQVQISEFVRSFYNFSRKVIPSIESESFLRFAASQNQICRPILGRRMSELNFVVANSETAMFSHEKQQVVLPAWYYNEKLLKLFISIEEPIDIESVSIVLSNGSSSHESLHAVYTDFDFGDFVGKIYKSNEKISTLNPELIGKLVNFLEDIFIEAERDLPLQEYALSFIRMKNMLLFNDNELRDAVKQLAEEENLQTLLSVIFHYKNEFQRDILHEIFTEDKIMRQFIFELDGIVKDASDCCSLENHDYRAIRYSEAISVLLEKFQQMESEGKSESEDEGEKKPMPKSEQSGDGNDESDGNDDSSNKDVEGEDSEEENNDESELEAKPDGEMFEGEKELLEKLAAMLNEEIELADRQHKIEEKNLTKKLDGRPFGRFDSVKVVDVISDFLVTIGTELELVKSPLNYSFLVRMKEMRNVNHTTGLARKSGAKLVGHRLQRIVTDNKVFANRETEVQTKNAPEVIILVDWSGSMGDLAFKVLSEAKAIHLALRSLNIPSSVYAHTGAIDESGAPYGFPGLFHVCSYSMYETNMDVDARFSRMTAIPLSHNYDGLVIEYLVEHGFTTKKSSKVLMSLSDGTPMGEGYDGRDADRHTMNVIQKARNEGKHILSLSLKRGVIEDNNRIYGSAMNINATISVKNAFEKVFKAMQANHSI